MLAVSFREGGALLVACFILKLKAHDSLVLEARMPYPTQLVDPPDRSMVTYLKTSTLSFKARFGVHDTRNLWSWYFKPTQLRTVAVRCSRPLTRFANQRPTTIMPEHTMKLDVSML